MRAAAARLPLLLAPAAARPAASTLTVDWAADGGSYTIAVGGKVWLTSGPTFTTSGGERYTTADGSLKHASGPTASSGSDALGAYTSVSHGWDAGGASFVTAVRSYAGAAVFSQRWPEGASVAAPNGTSPDAVSSCFPSVIPPAALGELGWLSWRGNFLKGSAPGNFSSTPTDHHDSMPTGGQNAGPFVVFRADTPEAVVFSGASHFMEQQWAADGGAYCSGLRAPIAHAEAGYSLDTIVYLGEGINGAAKAWGTALMRLHGTKRLQSDYTLTHLGYSGDHGSAYWYNPEGGSYEKTFEDVHDYAVKEGIPYKYALLDSWWYTKGKGGGVKQWDATTGAFPSGLSAFQKKTEWKLQLHNRHWAGDNVYATQNGGAYDFILDSDSHLAVPTEQRFWDDLIANKTAQTNGALAVYEQDWMYNEFKGNAALQSSSTLSDQWLAQMGSAAAKYNVSVQYCMEWPNMVLHTVQVNAVTQLRASDDYIPGVNRNSYMGTSAILAWALGLAPSKDNLWSTAAQNISSEKGHNETCSQYEATLSAYSTGPVQLGDAIGLSNASLIAATCDAAGTLLQPSAPMRGIDAAFVAAAFGTPGPVAVYPGQAGVLATHTDIGGVRWAHVLSAELRDAFHLRPAHIAAELAELGGGVTGRVAWSGFGAKAAVLHGDFSEARPLPLAACGCADYRVTHVAPVFGAVALLGETSKLVPVSAARVRSVRPSGGSIAVAVAGAPGERVELAFASGGEVAYVAATLSAQGTATITGP